MALRHTRADGGRPARAVVIGAAGFVGKAIAGRLEADGIPVVRLGRAEIDLTATGADRALAALLRPGDTCVFTSAKAPCKTPAMLAENIEMARNVCAALESVPVDHALYVSSDAVYGDCLHPMTEASPAAPESLHGAMHLARELMLRHTLSNRPFAILRPTLIYGADDPHNGYGPNQFRRHADAGRDIVLFGEGEERRDHVWIEDVASVASGAVLRRSVGTLNVVSGAVTTFRSLAEQIAALHGGRVKVVGTPRKGPMPHGGYRAFDAAAIAEAFPGLKLTQASDGVQRVHRALSGG